MAEALMLAAVLCGFVAWLLIVFYGAGGAEWLAAWWAQRPHTLPLVVTRPRLRRLLTEQAEELGRLEEQRLARFSENQRQHYTQQIDGLKEKCDALEASVKCSAANEAHRKRENAVVRAENKRLKEQVMLAAGAVPAKRAKAHAA